MAVQTLLAIDEADVIIFLVDVAKAPLRKTWKLLIAYVGASVQYYWQ